MLDITYDIKYTKYNKYNILLNKLLLKYKQNSNEFKNITNLEFSYFLYNNYDDEIRGAVKFEENVIDDLTKGSFKGLEKVQVMKDNKVPIIRKRDYEKINKAKQQQGTLAEKLVIKYLKKDSNLKIEHVSLSNDALGYDILVTNKKTNEVNYIEVKSSSSNSLNNISFYITINELEKMQQLNNYSIYYIYSMKHYPKFIEISKEDLKDSPEPIVFKYNLKEQE